MDYSKEYEEDRNFKYHFLPLPVANNLKRSKKKESQGYAKEA